MAETVFKSIETLRATGKPEEAMKALKKISSAQQSSGEYHYARGRVLEDLGQYDEALGAYEAALSADAKCRAARFRLGFLADLRGDEARAIECYEACVEQWSRDTVALLNLAMIYEERGYLDAAFYDRAAQCYRRILEFSPDNARARLGLRDAQAAKVMFYDEEQERRRDKRNQVLEVPVTDFELSVRSRNCLKKMNVRTLGDLIMHTEPDLLSYKNFGETSLAEVKEMLGSRGLYLGMGIEQQVQKPVMPLAIKPEPTPEVVAPNSAITDMLLETIEFSVRCRKCFQRLGLRTLGDLANLSETELMGIKNFGQTSLSEVKQKLRRYGLDMKE
jgi:DNA-directed RNA polymerase subunit alpha